MFPLVILLTYRFPLSGQFYAINFEGNVDPPTSEGDIMRVKVSIIPL